MHTLSYTLFYHGQARVTFSHAEVGVRDGGRGAGGCRQTAHEMGRYDDKNSGMCGAAGGRDGRVYPKLFAITQSKQRQSSFLHRRSKLHSAATMRSATLRITCIRERSRE